MKTRMNWGGGQRGRLENNFFNKLPFPTAPHPPQFFRFGLKPKKFTLKVNGEGQRSRWLTPASLHMKVALMPRPHGRHLTSRVLHEGRVRGTLTPLNRSNIAGWIRKAPFAPS